jgi:hypothetical protein
MGPGFEPGFPTSPHIICVSLVTRLLDKKKKKRQDQENLGGDCNA